MALGPLQHLRSARTGAVPGDGTIRQLMSGEFFVNETDGVVLYGVGGNSSGPATTMVTIGGSDMGADNTNNTNGVFGVGTATQTSYDLGMLSDLRAAVSDLGLLSQNAGVAIDLGLFSS